MVTIVIFGFDGLGSSRVVTVSDELSEDMVLTLIYDGAEVGTGSSFFKEGRI